MIIIEVIDIEVINTEAIDTVDPGEGDQQLTWRQSMINIEAIDRGDQHC